MHVSRLIHIFVDPSVFRSAWFSLTPSLLRARGALGGLVTSHADDLKLIAAKRPLGVFSLTMSREVESRDKLFFSTRWAMILEAGDSVATTAHALSALSELCEAYWRPVYVFLLKQGFRREDAEDLTQGFFAHLLKNRGYARADPKKGRFRSFLLGALKYFIADARDRERALKRGGAMIVESLDDNMEAQIAGGAKWQVDEVYDREWAASLVRHALDRLAQECALAGKSELFSYLMPHLVVREETAVPYREMAQRSHRTVAALHHERARLCARYRVILREEVRATVLDATDVDEELRYLCRVLAVVGEGNGET